GHPVREVVAHGHAVGDPRLLDLRLRAGDPLRHRGLWHEERVGDFRDREAAKQPQRERDPVLRWEGWVAPREDEPEPVVRHRSGGFGRGVIGEHGSLGVLLVADLLAPQPVDRLVDGDPGQPGRRIGRYTVAWPALESDEQRVGECLLCEVDVAEPADQPGDHATVLGAEDLPHGGQPLAWWKGGASIRPRQALDPRRAHSNASSRSSASMIQNPPRYSFYSEEGPSGITGASPGR